MLQATLAEVFSAIEAAAQTATVHGVPDGVSATLRLVTLLSDGADHLAANLAQLRAWSIAAPLPFGQALNTAINASPTSAMDARAILAGEQPSDAATRDRVAAIEAMAAKAAIFELADQDDRIRDHFLAMLDHPEDPAALSRFIHESSDRTGLAGRVMIEQSDLLIAVWDGQTTANVGGSGHTAKEALSAGVPVIWIDPASPSDWRIVDTPDALALRTDECRSLREGRLLTLVQDAIGLAPPEESEAFSGLAALSERAWRGSSAIGSHAYRRIEKLFGQSRWEAKFTTVRQVYERPADIAGGSGQPLLAALQSLPSGDALLPTRVGQEVLPRFAWANGIASHLSDLFRSGMVINFTLGPLAILAGLLYLPLVKPEQKWIFAAVELALLLMIVVNTISGQRARLHGRWLETRRVAEYLRHAPGLLALGIARTRGAWPDAGRSNWPEWYARQVERGIGLPRARVDHAYLRAAAGTLLDHSILPQLEYHRAKSAYLHHAHHSIEQLAERLFALAVVMVAIYLALVGASAVGLVASGTVVALAKWFTVSAVALPTIAGALAAIGYFGDFDRFAEISLATARRLETVAERVAIYLKQDDETLAYAPLADLARTADETTFAEIMAWQAVFNGKRTTVPA